MFLSQLNNLNNIIIDTIVDIDTEKAKFNCINSGLKKEIIDKILFSNSVDDIIENKNQYSNRGYWKC